MKIERDEAEKIREALQNCITDNCSACPFSKSASRLDECCIDELMKAAVSTIDKLIVASFLVEGVNNAKMLPTLTDFCKNCIYDNLEPSQFQEHHDPCTDCYYDAMFMVHPSEYVPKDGKTWGNNPMANSTTSETDKVKEGPGFDSVSHPSHYTEGRKYEPRKVIHDWELNFNLGNAVKYISRAGRKGDALEDLKKAKQYIEFEIEELESMN